MKINKPAHRCASAITKQAFLVAWDLWKDRNDVKHSAQLLLEQQDHLQLNHEIKEMNQVDMTGFSSKDCVCPWLSMRRHNCMTMDNKQRWLSTAASVRVAHANADPHNTAIAAHNHSIVEHFEPIDHE